MADLGNANFPAGMSPDLAQLLAEMKAAGLHQPPQPRMATSWQDLAGFAGPNLGFLGYSPGGGGQPNLADLARFMAPQAAPDILPKMPLGGELAQHGIEEGALPWWMLPAAAALGVRRRQPGYRAPYAGYIARETTSPSAPRPPPAMSLPEVRQLPELQWLGPRQLPAPAGSVPSTTSPEASRILSQLPATGRTPMRGDTLYGSQMASQQEQRNALIWYLTRGGRPPPQPWGETPEALDEFVRRALFEYRNRQQ
ncbi:MAG TPA: GlyGly-CTERM sorting domain-containing protein [Hyphomicrobiaceae bacterium]|jgi:hypothetical protein